MNEPHAGEPIVEHATLYAGGSMLVRPNDPKIEKLWPVEEWAKAMTEQGSHIYRRTVIVVSGWEEIKCAE